MVPSTVQTSLAPLANPPRVASGIRPLFSGAAKPASTAQVTSLFWELKTTSGHPLPVRLKSWTLVWR